MDRFRIRFLGEAELPSPGRVLAALPAGCRPVLLDSSDGCGTSLLAWSPDRILQGRLRPVRPTSGRGSRAPGPRAPGPGARWPLALSDPGRLLERVTRDEVWLREDASLFPAAGWIGYLGFECAHAVEPFPWVPPAPCGLPDYHLARYRRGLHFGRDGRAHLVWAEPLGAPSRARAERAELEAGFRALVKRSRTAAPSAAGLAALPRPLIPAGRFQEGVQRLREWIRDGELFQANLSHLLAGPPVPDPRALYARLRRAQPTGMSAYWESRDAALLSLSPETFLTVRGEELVTRPIKGTVGRPPGGGDPGAVAELESSVKERAELTMIVDMARHDLGRVAQPGGVEVVSPGEVEAFPTLFHRTATVRARWDPGRGLAALLRAVFPPASVTGAPKVRALQAISELERVGRGPYCGSFGIWEPGEEPRGSFSVLIRTAIQARSRFFLQVGAGIVWDSVAEKEWEETLLKARFLEAALDARPDFPAERPLLEERG